LRIFASVIEPRARMTLVGVVYIRRLKARTEANTQFGDW